MIDERQIRYFFRLIYISRQLGIPVFHELAFNADLGALTGQFRVDDCD
jgi:hypothetical protein